MAQHDATAGQHKRDMRDGEYEMGVGWEIWYGGMGGEYGMGGWGIWGDGGEYEMGMRNMKGMGNMG